MDKRRLYRESKAGCSAINLYTSRQCFFRENRLAQRRSSTGTGKAIRFESSEENNKWEVPFGVGRQNDRQSDRKAERGQLSCMAQVATTGRYTIVGMGRA
jgi:hypothetical protein